MTKEVLTAGQNQLPPVHPGEILREEFLEPMAMSRNALAKALGVTPARINEIANEKRGITADTAIKLAEFFGTSAKFWMNLQMDFDLKKALQNAA